MSPRVAAGVVATSLLATGCGSEDGDAGGATTDKPKAGSEFAAPAAAVKIASFKFVPKTVTIASGGSVSWLNEDKAPHTAENTGEKAPKTFDTGRLSNGSLKSVSFSEPGTYTYYCVYHRFMEATVIVR